MCEAPRASDGRAMRLHYICGNRYVKMTGPVEIVTECNIGVYTTSSEHWLIGLLFVWAPI